MHACILYKYIYIYSALCTYMYIYICILVFVAWLHLYGIVTAIVGPHKSGYCFQTDTVSINFVIKLFISFPPSKTAWIQEHHIQQQRASSRSLL